MSDESEPEESVPADPSLMPSKGKIGFVEYSPAEFAESLKEFYDALIQLGIEKTFAERLTIAFCERPG